MDVMVLAVLLLVIGIGGRLFLMRIHVATQKTPSAIAFATFLGLATR